MEFQITGLYSYPVKSFAASTLQEAIIDDFGFVFDRRFMLVDKDGVFITLRRFPLLSVVKTEYAKEVLTLSHASFGCIQVHLDDFTDVREVHVWQDRVQALSAPRNMVAGLSEFLGVEVYLAYMPDSSFRQVDQDFFSAFPRRVSFADAFPFLLTNEASLADLNGRLDNDLAMGRFRPNIVFRGDNAFQEDSWKRIRIGVVEFSVVKPCSRCVATTIDSAGEKLGKEPLKTLSSYRRNEFGVCFGQNLVHHSRGVISVGDMLSVLE